MLLRNLEERFVRTKRYRDFKRRLVISDLEVLIHVVERLTGNTDSKPSISLWMDLSLEGEEESSKPKLDADTGSQELLRDRLSEALKTIELFMGKVSDLDLVISVGSSIDSFEVLLEVLQEIVIGNRNLNCVYLLSADYEVYSRLIDVALRTKAGGRQCEFTVLPVLQLRLIRSAKDLKDLIKAGYKSFLVTDLNERFAKDRMYLARRDVMDGLKEMIINCKDGEAMLKMFINDNWLVKAILVWRELPGLTEFIEFVVPFWQVEQGGTQEFRSYRLRYILPFGKGTWRDYVLPIFRRKRFTYMFNLIYSLFLGR